MFQYVPYDPAEHQEEAEKPGSRNHKSRTYVNNGKPVDDKIIEQWTKLKSLMLDVELDILQSSIGNRSAGVRARHKLRDISWAALALVKIMIGSHKDFYNKKHGKLVQEEVGE